MMKLRVAKLEGVTGGEAGGVTVLGPEELRVSRHSQKIIYTSRFVRVILAQGPC